MLEHRVANTPEQKTRDKLTKQNPGNSVRSFNITTNLLADHFFPDGCVTPVLTLVAAALCARAAKLPFDTPPSPDFAVDDWILAAASPVIGVFPGMVAGRKFAEGGWGRLSTFKECFEECWENALGNQHACPSLLRFWTAPIFR